MRPYLLLLATFVVLQAYFFTLPFLGTAGDWIAYFVVPIALLGLLSVWIRLERRPAADFGWVLYEKPWRTVAVVAALVAAFVAVAFEARLFVGFSTSPLPSPPVTLALAVAAPLIVVSQLGIFQGYALHTLSDGARLVRALGITAVSFALATTNFNIVTGLSGQYLGQYLFTTAGTSFVLAVVLGVYTYKARWSLFGPALLGTALLLLTTLSPIGLGTSNWEFSFLVELVGYTAILVLVLALVREPGYFEARYLGRKFGAKKYRYLRRERASRSLRRTGIALVVVVVISIASVAGLQAWSGLRTPLLAVATGSMVPALEPGDLVVVEHVPQSQITVGSIIAYSGICLPAPTVHRVISVDVGPDGTSYITKGDANPSPDACPVPYAEVLGKVVFVVPYAGYLILEPVAVLGVTAVAVLVASFAWRGKSWPPGSES